MDEPKKRRSAVWTVAILIGLVMLLCCGLPVGFIDRYVLLHIHDYEQAEPVRIDTVTVNVDVSPQTRIKTPPERLQGPPYPSMMMLRDFSPLTNNLFAANGDFMDNALGLLIGIVMLSCVTALGITSIVACCYLGKRLGYDLYSGLLLLIPGVNLFVFFLWAFKESPNERKLRKYFAKPA